jgi:hypothetical protein
MSIPEMRFYLSLTSADLSANAITTSLDVAPSTFYNKGDFKRDGVAWDWSFWELSTDYIESYDAAEVIDALLEEFERSQAELKELIARDDVSADFTLEIGITNNDLPSLSLEKNILDFASAIGAEIHFDIQLHEVEDEHSCGDV